MLIQIPMTTKMTGRQVMVMSASFHCTTMATMKEATNVTTAWVIITKRSAIPWLTRFVLVVSCVAGELVAGRLKCQISIGTKHMG